MSLATYSDLKTAIANFYSRSDMSSDIDDFIDLTEAELQRELKLVDFEASGTVSVTSGSGNLPSGFVGMRSVSWDANPDRVLTYVAPERWEAINASLPSDVSYYTIIGTTIKVADDQTGTLNLTYLSRFTPLSGLATSNAMLTNHPDVYLFGCLKHAAIKNKDFDTAANYAGMFSGLVSQIRRDNQQRKYGHSLRVIPA